MKVGNEEITGNALAVGWFCELIGSLTQYRRPGAHDAFNQMAEVGVIPIFAGGLSPTFKAILREIGELSLLAEMGTTFPEPPGLPWKICPQCHNQFDLKLGMRASRIYCSNACRVAVYRERHAKTTLPTV